MQRFFAFLFLPFLCAASPAPKLLSNLMDIYAAWDGPIGKLARTDASLITRTSSHQVDAESCQSVTGREMGRALYSCTPLLEIFSAVEPLRFNTMTRGYLPDPKSLVSKAFAKNSDAFFALAGGRQYPAADVAIVQVHLIRSLVFESRGSNDKANAELDAAIQIIATTEIADPEFDNRALLTERKNLLAKRP
ncbi:hypothetical protein [Parasphingorhabdus cellanae]|uniref:Uncharacterized protein n=1 Tax=Parasphingorhabdus cellanae TaxID=2806553 RepID=A0ABX7T050_9SPHN|nr:hypothetical protein [Parasphingorhabdus cellanae]QTD54904.1 hypothetical protein J4G78_11685 [Parasphingorhabdus cellanae]